MSLIERPKVLEHAVAREVFQRTSGEVGSGAHHQQVRDVVVIQFLYDVLHIGQSVGVSQEGTRDVHWPDLDSDSARLHKFEHRLNDFEKETRAVHGRAAILICAQIRGAVQELSDEIEVVSLDLDAIESSFHGILCRGSKISHRLTNFIFAHWARCYGGLPS